MEGIWQKVNNSAKRGGLAIERQAAEQFLLKEERDLLLEERRRGKRFGGI